MDEMDRIYHMPSLSEGMAAMERKQTGAEDESPAPSPPPDGGMVAWLQVGSLWATVFCTFGLVNSFGVYQTYYEDVLLPSSTSSDISWIGSIQACLLLAGGMISGPFYDKGYFRELICSGLFLVIFGQFMTSLCTTFWQVVLAQGVCIGVGCGIVFLPANAVLAQYFSRRIALAAGIGSSGSPVAGVILPIVFNQLVDRLGFGWATRIIAFILLGMSMIPILFFKTRLPPARQSRALIDMSALSDLPYMLFVAGGFFAFMGVYVAFFYIELFTVEHDLASATFAPYMLTFMNAASIIGRVFPGLLADYTSNPSLVMAGCAFISCILDFAWLGIRNFGGTVAYTVLYGAFSGGVVSLQPACVFMLTTDISRVGTRLGMSTLVAGLAVLVGSPVGGAILGTGSSSESKWNGLIGFAAACLLIGAVLIMSTGLITHYRLRRKASD
jgi:MFS family permease